MHDSDAERTTDASEALAPPWTAHAEEVRTLVVDDPACRTKTPTLIPRCRVGSVPLPPAASSSDRLQGGTLMVAAAVRHALRHCMVLRFLRTTRACAS
jgi:hypothetical protein